MSHGHRRVELISIELHRLVAGRLDEEIISRTRIRLNGWLRSAPASSPIAKDWQAWLNLLEQPIPLISKTLVEDTERMQQMRQNSPFAGVVSEDERLQILEKYRISGQTKEEWQKGIVKAKENLQRFEEERALTGP